MSECQVTSVWRRNTSLMVQCSFLIIIIFMCLQFAAFVVQDSLFNVSSSLVVYQSNPLIMRSPNPLVLSAHELGFGGFGRDRSFRIVS